MNLLLFIMPYFTINMKNFEPPPVFCWRDFSTIFLVSTVLLLVFSTFNTEIFCVYGQFGIFHNLLFFSTLDFANTVSKDSVRFGCLEKYVLALFFETLQLFLSTIFFILPDIFRQWAFLTIDTLLTSQIIRNCLFYVNLTIAFLHLPPSFFVEMVFIGIISWSIPGVKTK